MQAVNGNSEWRWTIRACCDWIARREAQRNEVLSVDEKWVEMSTAKRPLKLKPLVGYGILERKSWCDQAGKKVEKQGRRALCLMPDRPGVGRALDEADVPPTVFL
jgi:hypothetical protein